MLHNRILAEDEGITNDYKWDELGCNTKEEIMKELERRAEEAVNEVHPDHMKDRLKRMLGDHISMFKLHLGKDIPAMIKPMNIRIDKKNSQSNSSYGDIPRREESIWIATCKC